MQGFAQEFASACSARLFDSQLFSAYGEKGRVRAGASMRLAQFWHASGLQHLCVLWRSMSTSKRPAFTHPGSELS